MHYMKKVFFNLKKFLLQGPAHFTHLFPTDTETNLLYTLNPTTYTLFSHHLNIILSPLVGKPPTHHIQLTLERVRAGKKTAGGRYLGAKTANGGGIVGTDPGANGMRRFFLRSWSLRAEPPPVPSSSEAGLPALPYLKKKRKKQLQSYTVPVASALGYLLPAEPSPGQLLPCLLSFLAFVLQYSEVPDATGPPSRS